MHDVIIVGSGPAGISTALHLVQILPELKNKILVLEAKCHPRPKLCAGGILQDGEYILKKLGLDCSEVPSLKVNQAHFLYEGRGICIARFMGSFIVVRRDEFDAWLVNEARKRGINVLEENRVLHVEPDGRGMRVKTDRGEYFSRIVVGADGVNSLVRRSIVKKSKSGSSQSTTLEIMVTPGEFPKGFTVQPNQAFFDFSIISKGVQGYIWKFPTRENGLPACTRGIYHARVISKRSPESLQAILGRQLAGEKININDFELQGKPIRFFEPKGTFSAPGVVLVGDAAGVDPIYGEGISFALGYGELAAAEIKEALDTQDFSFSHYKKRILRHPMGICLQRRLRIARLLYRFRYRWFQRLLWWNFGFLLKWYIEHRLIDWAKPMQATRKV
jgi:flavin-dependent dehydrogenase